jgi:nitrogen fixation/metabolism regulation signal transduction histidine kinase
VKQRFRARFRLTAVAQVIGLAVTMALLAYTSLNSNYIAVPVVLGVVILLQVWLLLRSVEAHVDTLEDFFAAINYEDFTRQYVTDDVDAELKEAFNDIIDRFRRARAERDVQAGYLETVVRHVPIPLMAVRADGQLRLVNNPLRRLTGLANLGHIQDLASLDPALPQMMRSIETGQQRLLQTRFREVPVELRVAVAELRLAGDTERIYSVENLSGELSARESSAWRNLIRVLTHEIMNTLTPVASLAQTALTIADVTDETADDREELKQAIGTIARRSQGLIHFVERYRELLQVPQPRPEPTSVDAALRSVVRLMGEELRSVEVLVDVTPVTLEVQADPALLDQVLVNLVRNAAHAMQDTEKPLLILRGRLEFGRTLLQVIDNGAGIPESIQDQVFIPFFTTKRDGSGIGLSLSRQIMMAHGGELVASSDDAGTTMSLLL